MSEPTQFHIGPHTYEIQWTRKQGPNWGTSWPNKLRVRICTRKHSLSQQQSTLLHEYIHCALHQAGAPTWDWLTEEREESLIRAMEGPLLELFRPKNRSLLEWLTSHG